MQSHHIFTQLCALLLCIVLSQAMIFANELFQEDGILPNHSAEYVRTLNRNASVDADAAFYNPAGLPYMQEGLYIMYSSQTYYKKRVHTMNYYYLDIYAPSFSIDEEGPTQNGNAFTTRPTGSLKSHNTYFMETTAPVIPDINIIYRTNYLGKECALYYSFGIMQAAPEVVFPKGLAQIDFGTMAAGE
ncbi:MAG: hypothetical protein N3F66_13735 [Spirochaetes bacterium]|nr:hypothetical protein [Spirochaetota bacterium]